MTRSSRPCLTFQSIPYSQTILNKTNSPAAITCCYPGRCRQGQAAGDGHGVHMPLLSCPHGERGGSVAGNANGVLTEGETMKRGCWRNEGKGNVVLRGGRRAHAPPSQYVGDRWIFVLFLETVSRARQGWAGQNIYTFWTEIPFYVHVQ